MKDQTIDYLLRTTWQAVVKMYNEQAAQFDTTMATGFALLSIDPEAGTPSTALGPRMGMEATSLSRTLKTMENRGLIVRKPNPDDGRGVLIHLTEFGREKINFHFTPIQLTVTSGQLDYEIQHLKNKLKLRDPEKLKLFSSLSYFEPHPMFEVIEGKIEEWEIVM